MSVDKLLREMVRAEVQNALAPMHAAIAELQATSAVVARLAAVLGQPLKRGPGRPAALKLGKAKRAKAPRRAAAGDARPCAVIDCGRPARSKGYCAAHYQKYRMLAKSDRLPADWKPDAAPNSVENLVLPRGRAGAKALAEAKKK